MIQGFGGFVMFSLSPSKIGSIQFSNTKKTLKKMLVRKCSYLTSIKCQFLLWHHVKYVLTECFCKDPLESWFGRQRSLGSRKYNPSIASIADFGYNNNAIRKQKIKPIANGNVADRGMIALSDEPLTWWKGKKEWRFRCKYWINKFINSCFSENMIKYKLTAYLINLLCFFYIYKYLNIYWANLGDLFITTSTKTTIFIATHHKNIWHTYHYYQDYPSLIVKRYERSNVN